MTIHIHIIPQPTGQKFDLEIVRGADHKWVSSLPGDQTFTRIQEHVNNALLLACRDLEQVLKSLRAGGSTPATSNESER